MKNAPKDEKMQMKNSRVFCMVALMVSAIPLLFVSEGGD
jgi:hypothetical protein